MNKEIIETVMTGDQSGLKVTHKILFFNLFISKF